MIVLKKILIISIISFFVNISYAVYIPSSLDRGHKLILENGLQVRGLAFPGFETWNSTRWAESEFNTPNLHETPRPDLLGVAAPGIPWSRWVKWADITGAQGPYLYDNEIPYIPNLVTLQASDELWLDANTINILKNTFDIWELFTRFYTISYSLTVFIKLFLRLQFLFKTNLWFDIVIIYFFSIKFFQYFFFIFIHIPSNIPVDAFFS